MGQLLELIGLLELTAAREPDADSGRTPTRRLSLVKHEEVAKHRSLWCAEYDACLDEVLRCGWASWTCRRCERFLLRSQARALVIACEASERSMS